MGYFLDGLISRRAVESAKLNRCLWCGKEIRNKRRKYCSDKCQKDYHRHQRLKGW